jgi:nucleotide-binding universal stress UspA family protein
VYKHILIPTDGSRLAGKGVKAGVRLARALGAKVTGVYVMAPYYVPPAYVEGAVYVPGVSPQAYRKYSERQAKKALASIETEAKSARVPCATRFVTAPKPGEGILKTARALGCDLIAMASHGRGRLGALLLGSETSRVLARSKVPVVVLR